MKTSISILLGLGLVCGVLSIAWPARLVAQDGAKLGYGLGPGEAVVIIVPEDVTEPSQRGMTLTKRVKVTGAPGNATSVGTCHQGNIAMQPADALDPDGNEDAAPMEFAVLYPEGAELPTGTLMGAWRPGGPCGPGYEIMRGHILVTDY